MLIKPDLYPRSHHILEKAVKGLGGLCNMGAHLAALDDVLPAEPLVVGSLAAPENLGAQDHVRALPAQLLCTKARGLVSVV